MRRVSAAPVPVSLHSPFTPPVCQSWDEDEPRVLGGTAFLFASFPPPEFLPRSSAAAILPLSHSGSAAVETPNDTELALRGAKYLPCSFELG